MTPVRVVALFVAAFAFWFSGYEIVDHTQKKWHDDGYAEGRTQFIGRPMKYMDVPKGHYSVVAIVDRYQPYVAVIEKDIATDGYTTHESRQYLLVTDLMPNMMAEHFTFTAGGTQ